MYGYDHDFAMGLGFKTCDFIALFVTLSYHRLLEAQGNRKCI
jgi:hypothetical protein